MFLISSALLAIAIVPSFVYAQFGTNTTIDDSDPSIQYNGLWAPDVDYTSALDYGGSHRVGEAANATATFSFTGIAIYYWAPLWPYPVNTMLTVDNNITLTVDLQDPSVPVTEVYGGEETAQSSVRAVFKGLSDGEHTLVASMAPGGRYVIMDALTFTDEDIGVATVTTIMAIPASTFTAIPASTVTAFETAVPAPMVNSSGHRRLSSAAVGGIVLAAVVVVLAALFLIRSRYLRRAKPGIEEAMVSTDTVVESKEAMAKLKEVEANEKTGAQSPPPPAYPPPEYSSSKEKELK